VTVDIEGIQNGSPDGMALCRDGAVVTSGRPVFFSYEGTFTASGGCAAGMESFDIGVAEASDTPVGQSLQLIGSGITFGRLTAASWDGPFPETPGALRDDQALPVELVAFTATATPDGVTLEWRTASETNNAGFHVEHRAPGAETFADAGFRAGAGTTTEAQQYRFRLRDAVPGAHRFRLRQVDTDGTASVSKTIDVQVQLDGPFQLSDASPNPVRAQATLDLAVREAQPVRVALYNVLGQRIATLHDGPVQPASPLTIRVAGERLSSGLYFVRVEGETFTATRKVTVVR
jgi:hypothetical protein